MNSKEVPNSKVAESASVIYVCASGKQYVCCGCPVEKSAMPAAVSVAIR